MIKTVDEAIKHCEDKYNELKDTCIECAEEHKQLAEWLKDYKEVKRILNESVAEMNKIINDYKSKIEEINNEKSNENNRWNMIYENYTKNQIDENITEEEIKALEEGLCQ